MDNSQLCVNRDIALTTTPLRKAFDLDAVPKQETMCRATEVEHAKLVALVDMLTLVHSDIACRDLNHTHTDERHGPDGRIIRFDVDDGAGGHNAQVGLRSDNALGVDVGVVLQVGHTVPQRLGIVGAVDNVGLEDAAGDGRVPAVVAKGVQEGLVDGATDELLRHGVFAVVAAQHVQHGVRLLLHPELVVSLHVVLEAEGLRFTGVDDNTVVARARDGANPRAEDAGEEIVPGRVAAVLGGWFGVEHLVVSIIGVTEVVTDGSQVVQTVRAEPVGIAGVTQHIGRVGRLQVRTPDIQHLVDHAVDIRVDERRKATRCAHGPDKDVVER